MEQNIKFNFESYEIVPVMQDGEILFNANEICAALGFGNPRQALDTHVDFDDVQKLDTIDSMGRNQVSNFITEFGLYALILGSTKDEAKRFKRWVTHEVLPSIRKQGFYGTPEYLQMKAEAEKVQLLEKQTKNLLRNNEELRDDNQYLSNKASMWANQRIERILREEILDQIRIRHAIEEGMFCDAWGEGVSKSEANTRTKFVKSRCAGAQRGIRGLEKVLEGTEHESNLAMLTYIDMIRHEIGFARHW